LEFFLAGILGISNDEWLILIEFLPLGFVECLDLGATWW
jgi:hypothetical protein